MASVVKTAKGYRAQVYVKGQRDSATFRTKREADAWAAAREVELRTQADLSPADRHSLAEALIRYRDEVSPTKRGARWEEIRITAFLRDENLPTAGKLGEITPADIGLWRDARLKVVSSGAVLREMGLLSAVLEEARREWRWIPSNPMRDVRKPKEPDHREVVITRAQIRSMLAVMQYRPGQPCRSVTGAVAVAFLLALRTGMRAGELCGLTWDRVFPGYCRTPHKTGRTAESLRDVPLTPKSERLIRAMRGYDPGLVLGLKPQSLDAMFRKYRQRAGLDGFTFHDSRHTAATWMAQRLHVLDLCKAMGWSNPAQAMTYYNPKASDIAKRIDPCALVSRLNS